MAKWRKNGGYCQEADQRYSYALSNAAPDTAAERLAWLKCVRHFVERSNQDAKSEVGWDEFQARSSGPGNTNWP